MDFFNLVENPYTKVIVYLNDSDDDSIENTISPVYSFHELSEFKYVDGQAAAHSLYAKYWESEVETFWSDIEYGSYFEEVSVVAVVLKEKHG